jgi:hypothetical protein
MRDLQMTSVLPNEAPDVLPGFDPGRGGVTRGSCDVLPGLDTRLIAAVQRGAGARCHEAANLLYAYYLWTDVVRQMAAAGETGPDADDARQQVQNAKVRLRAFLTAARN